MKLVLDDVIRVKEDLQFHYALPYDAIVGHTWKVTTVVNDDSVLVQKCTCSGAVTHSRTKRVRNPDMDWAEFTDYYEVIKTQDPDKRVPMGQVDRSTIADVAIRQDTVQELLDQIDASSEDFKVQAGGVWYGPNWDWIQPSQEPPHPSTIFTDPDFVNPDEEESGEIKSDGGSSSYYDIPIPDWLIASILERHESDQGAYIKTQELIEVAFDNDFDFGNLFKSSVRAMGKRKGAGKAGNTLEYECNKMHYSVDKIKVLGSRGEDHSSLS